LKKQVIVKRKVCKQIVNLVCSQCRVNVRRGDSLPLKCCC